MNQKGPGLIIICGRRDNGHVHASHFVHFCIVDFWKQCLITKSHGVVAAAVEGIGWEPSEIADTRESDTDRSSRISEILAS